MKKHSNKTNSQNSRPISGGQNPSQKENNDRGNSPHRSEGPAHNQKEKSPSTQDGRRQE